MVEGWIKLHRSLIDHPVWACSNLVQRTILITILTMVNFKPNKWIWKNQEYEVEAGQMITSLESIASRCGKEVSVRNVRTALKKFEMLNFLTDESTKQGRLISVVNWGIYQARDESSDKEIGNQLTDDRQTPDRQVTTIEEGKKDKIEKNDKNSSPPKRKHKLPKGWKPKDSHYEKALSLNMPRNAVDELAERMFNWSHGNGHMMLDWDLSFHNWIKKESEKYNKAQNNGQGSKSNWENVG